MSSYDAISNTISPNSDTVPVFLVVARSIGADIDVLPFSLQIENTSDKAVLIKLLSPKDGDGPNVNGIFIPAGASRTIEGDSSDEGIYKVGATLAVAAAAVSVNVTAFNFKAVPHREA